MESWSYFREAYQCTPRTALSAHTKSNMNIVVNDDARAVSHPQATTNCSERNLSHKGAAHNGSTRDGKVALWAGSAELQLMRMMV